MVFEGMSVLARSQAGMQELEIRRTERRSGFSVVCVPASVAPHLETAASPGPHLGQQRANPLKSHHEAGV